MRKINKNSEVYPRMYSKKPSFDIKKIKNLRKAKKEYKS